MFAEDLAEFFDPEEHGTAAVYTHGGTSATVNGIFDNPASTGFGMVEDQSPAFLCAVADVPSVANNDTLVIGGATYKVKGTDPDGTGLVRLKLQKQ